MASGFTAEERAAMKERAAELKAEKTRAAGEADLLAKIAEMPAGDRAIAEHVHTVVTSVAPELTPKTWYGQPAYARDGEVVCFFQSAAKFSTRYCTLGFSEIAKLDDGAMWPTSYALTEWNADVEKAVGALVAKAVG